MAFWWVSQNQTYQEERSGGFIWAPDHDKAGNVPHHWATVSEVRAGDIIFSYVGKKIVSVSVAETDAFRAKKPEEFSENAPWEKNGRRVTVTYTDLQPGLEISTIIEVLTPLLPERYSPLTAQGTGNQGYLFSLPPQAGRLLLGRTNQESLTSLSDAAVDAVLKSEEIPITERIAIVKSRVGQGRYREELSRIWQGKCAVTSLDLPALLRASHSKPWGESNNLERMDPYNGLFLSPAYDAAFDAGLISFSEDGKIILSSRLSSQIATKIGISSDAALTRLDSRHKPYLEYHRVNVFE